MVLKLTPIVLCVFYRSMTDKYLADSRRGVYTTSSHPIVTTYCRLPFRDIAEITTHSNSSADTNHFVYKLSKTNADAVASTVYSSLSSLDAGCRTFRRALFCKFSVVNGIPRGQIMERFNACVLEDELLRSAEYNSHNDVPIA